MTYQFGVEKLQSGEVHVSVLERLQNVRRVDFVRFVFDFSAQNLLDNVLQGYYAHNFVHRVSLRRIRLGFHIQGFSLIKLKSIMNE